MAYYYCDLLHFRAKPTVSNLSCVLVYGTFRSNVCHLTWQKKEALKKEMDNLKFDNYHNTAKWPSIKDVHSLGEGFASADKRRGLRCGRPHCLVVGFFEIYGVFARTTRGGWG